MMITAAAITARRRATALLTAAVLAGVAWAVHTPPVAAAVAPPTVAHPVMFIDTFSSGTLAGWTTYDEGTVNAPSAWSVDSSHRLQQASNIFGGSLATADLARPGTHLVAGSAGWKNYDLKLTVRPMDNDEVGVVFRFADTKNHYRFSMNSEKSYMRLVKKVNGVSTLLARNATAYTVGTTYALRILAVGSRIMVYVNGTLTFDVTDTSLTKGKIGLWTWGSSMTKFDSVSAAVEAADDSFSIAVVPDTQYESKSFPAMLTSQMKYLAANRANLNLAMVLQEGDVVDTASAPTQWTNATAGFRQINGKVPFVVAAGNHDMFTYVSSAEPYAITRTPFNTFVSGLSDYKPSGTFAPKDYLNTYKLFSAGGVDMVVVNLEFGADDAKLAWAGTIADKYPTRHVLLLTHDYLSEKNAHRGSDPADLYLPKNYHPTMNNGIDMWTELVSQHPNIQFVFNGHVIAPVSSTQNYSVGRLVSTNQAGRPVYQVLTNYQTLAPGGQGYLRIFRFYPSLGKVAVTTYSPYQKTGLTDPLNKFTFLDVDLGSWAP